MTDEPSHPPAPSGAGGAPLPAGRAVAAKRGWRWIAEGWAFFRRQPGTWIGMMVVYAVFLFLAALVPFFGTFAMQLLGPVFAGGVILGCRQSDRGGELEFLHLFAGFRDHFGSLVLLGLVYVGGLFVSLVLGASLAGIGFGSLGAAMEHGGSAMANGMQESSVLLAMLIFMALMVPLAMAMWFAPALIVLDGGGVGEALRVSFQACLRNISPFLIFGIIALLLSIPASLILGLGWLVLGPVLAASVYCAYRDVFHPARARAE